MKPLKEILKNDNSFRVQWGKSTQVPFLGWICLNVQEEDGTSSATLDVLYLITSGNIVYLLLGFNAIREMVKIKMTQRC